MQTISHESGQEGVSTGYGPSKARRFVATLLGVTLIIWLLPWGLMRLPRFILWSGTFYGSMLEYAFSESRTDADVVIFGDSSALFGIDPLQIKAETGLTVVNLPNTISSLPVINDMALRAYLTHNVAPRLIVFYFAPWNLNYRNVEPTTSLYEGVEMLARHGTSRQIIAFARSHAAEAALFPFKFYSANSLSIFLSRLRDWHRDPPISRARGHHDLLVPATKLMKQPCRFPDTLLHDSQIDSALELERRYEGAATKVLFYMAPVPQCQNAEVLATIPYPELTAASPQEMDPDDYDDDGYFIHLDRRAVPQATQSLLVAMLKELGLDQGHAKGRDASLHMTP